MDLFINIDLNYVVLTVGKGTGVAGFVMNIELVPVSM